MNTRHFGGKTSTFSLRVPSQMVELIDTKCKEAGLNRNAFINNIIEDYLNNEDYGVDAKQVMDTFDGVKDNLYVIKDCLLGLQAQMNKIQNDK